MGGPPGNTSAVSRALPQQEPQEEEGRKSRAHAYGAIPALQSRIPGPRDCRPQTTERQTQRDREQGAWLGSGSRAFRWCSPCAEVCLQLCSCTSCVREQLWTNGPICASARRLVFDGRGQVREADPKGGQDATEGRPVRVCDPAFHAAECRDRDFGVQRETFLSHPVFHTQPPHRCREGRIALDHCARVTVRWHTSRAAHIETIPSASSRHAARDARTCSPAMSTTPSASSAASASLIASGSM